MKRGCVLIVDDEKNIRLILSRAIEGLGIETKTAVNGEDALAKLDGCAFDLMLLDLNLPGMNGLAVLQKARTSHPHLPVVIITAHGTVDSAVEAMKAGAMDFIQKPFSPEEIREAVSRGMSKNWSADGGVNGRA